jgi:hypothetical protein
MKTYLCLCMHFHSCLVLASMHCVCAVHMCTVVITLNCSILARIWEYCELSEAQYFWRNKYITVIMLFLCFPSHLITNTITLELKVYVNICIIKVCCKLRMKEQLLFLCCFRCLSDLKFKQYKKILTTGGSMIRK